MQLSERDKVLQVQRIKQWNGMHDTGIKHCHLPEYPGWAQKSLRKSRWFSQHKDTWWKDRGFVENQGSCDKTTDLPWKSTQNLRSLYLQALQTQIGKEGTHGTKLWHSAELHAWVQRREKKSDNPERNWGRAKLPIVGTRGSGGTTAGSRLQRQKTKYVKRHLEKSSSIFT